MLDHPRYEATEVLGKGAQGLVVRVIDRERPHAKLVAKILRSSAPEQRLAGEFALLSRLHIPGLVRVHDFARDAAGRPFFVEDLAEGLEPRAAIEGRASALARFVAELGETLAALHDAGFVHGDVKPANVRFPADGDGRAMLLDLGAAIAARESDEDVVLTPAFAAPEVRAGARPSRASDIFSLGATVWAAATDAPPGRGVLRDFAPWVTPTLADAIDRSLAEHPADRPRSALDLVAAAGRARAAVSWEGGGRGTHAREETVRELGRVGRGVTYVSGPSGAGKSHVVREVMTRALLAGRSSRLVRFPEVDATFVGRLVAWLRGDRSSRPFVSEDDALLVVLDDLHAAPIEVAEALDAFRCRGDVELTVLATTREAPVGAANLRLHPLDAASFARLCDELDIPERERARIERTAGGLPGWVVAAAGRMPLAKDAVLARVGSLPPASRALVALTALLGGDAPAAAMELDDVAPAFAAGLLERDRDHVRLVAHALASDLATALADADLVERATALALAQPDLPASSLASIARAPFAPHERVALLVALSERARTEGARSIEIEALLALVADPKERTIHRLTRLERLTRDAGTARAHPQVLEWIEAAAPGSTLALRRRAEAQARAGDFAAARVTAERAVAAARRSELAYAEGTRAAVALWAADWEAAAEAFKRMSEASAAEAEAEDEEEIARIEHNAGVVALYRGEHDVAADAFERSMEIKRALGDRAGVRSCALNLALARTKQRRFEESRAALDEALALAESLGQAAGRGWCLAARAELEVRRERPRDAERFVAEAEALGDIVPKTVRADLALLRAEIALAESNGSAAQAALGVIDGGLRAEDALVDARCLVIESVARLVTLPVNRRKAARAAIAAIRRARAGRLPDVEKEAIAALRRVRRVKEPRNMASESGTDPDLWELIGTFGREPLPDCAHALAKWLVTRTKAERAFVIVGDESVFGADLDGFAIGDADKRVDREALAKARRANGVVYEPDVARIVACGSRAAIVIEHRFAKSAFDGIAHDEARRWALLADLVARMGEPTTNATGAAAVIGAEESSSSVLQAGMSTAMPRREVTREYPEIIGRSASLRRALAALDAAVDTELPVLVRGETGTGKELFARALHDHGARHQGPFVAVNCAAIADALFEAELFGHARGAFTGADRARGGLLARAEGGTLLLDEIGELSLMRQATLLRVLESKRYRAVGSDDERSFDVRIVAATNRDLDAAVEEGTFRKDLLYRLRVLEVIVPPLRERTGDVDILFRHFLARSGSRATISASAMEALGAYPFPGNVRELLHQAQRLAASNVSRIEVAHLPRAVRSALAEAPAGAEGDAERADVERALARTAGNISQAAGLLGITRHGLKKRMLRLGLRAKGTAS